MSTLAKKNGGFWPKMIQDFFGADPFAWDEKFWSPEKAIEVPSANVIENDKEFKLELSAPGFDKKDFKVEVSDGILNISAEKEHKTEEKKENYRKKEFSYSSIRRSFSLPDNVLDDKIDAKYDNGILNVIIPKNEKVENKSKKAITVN
ncbi:Hsp20/alpha crystallin family protein [Cecembia calidifontis]|uniref:HSP20 family protein n=1 Tax=Cecembia calidifontis TaxID=1187080 RepID=A0A4Q7P9E4_9BACT|nr:Hsp20/alpha crystallin family protein [Cecembia calidifontis]RZS96836.1 HSP20 family protein [Cecembia calidifontis]